MVGREDLAHRLGLQQLAETGVGSKELGAEGESLPAPRWIAGSLELKEGRDPLGLQTTTQDRLMPVLLPGILELSRRARYLSFHSFLLDEYERRRMRPDTRSLSTFIKRCEWDLGLAVRRCPNGCDSSPVGARRLGGLPNESGPFRRWESVESPMGGYGLYYRSPLISLGIVAGAGTLLGGEPIPIDVLRRTEGARRLAQEFRSAVEKTAYYQQWMWTDDDLPSEVIDEYAAVACLCRIRERPAERDAIHDALFGVDQLGESPSVVRPDGFQDDLERLGEYADAPGVIQRRRSVAHYLSLVDARPEVVADEGAFRQSMWSPPPPRTMNHAVVAGQWAALIAKDYWQEAICSVWSHFCRTGLAVCRDLGRGLTWDETRNMVIGLAVDHPPLEADRPTHDVAAALASGKMTVSVETGQSQKTSAMSLESLREFAVLADSSTAGLVVLLELAHRARRRTGVGWDRAIRMASAWQPSVAHVLAGLHAHLEIDPSVGDTLWWLVSQFIIPIHERISYSKLPEFTFRFRWEEGLLRFYDHGVGRFPLAAIRNVTLASLTSDLGLWEPGGGGGHRQPSLTDRGRLFLQEALA